MRLFDNTLSVLGHHFALITRGKVAFVDNEVGENDGYLAGMAGEDYGNLILLLKVKIMATLLISSL